MTHQQRPLTAKKPTINVLKGLLGLEVRSNDAHPAPWSVASIANLKQLEIGRQIPLWVSRPSSASFPAGTRSRTPSCSCRRRSPVTTVFAVEYRLFSPSCMYIVPVPNFIMRRASNSNSTYFAPSSLVLMAAQTATRAPWLDLSAAHAIVHLFFPRTGHRHGLCSP